jgi:thiol:disulfide interchange protein DsbD
MYPTGIFPQTARRAVAGCILILLGIGMPPLARAADDPDPFSEGNRQVPKTANRIDFTATISQKEAKPGDVITVTITGKPRAGFHTYPLTRRAKDQQEDQLATVLYLDSSVFKPLYPVNETEAEVKDEGVVGKLLEHEHEFTWTQDFLVLQPDRVGTKYLSLAVYLQVCDQSCEWGWHFFDFPVVLASADPVSPSREAELKQRFTRPALEVYDPAKDVITSEDDDCKETTATDLPSFLGLAVLWGAVSLVTPCVFPMIPITVSFFIKQSEAKKHSPLLLAAVYSGTITAVLTLGGIFLIQILQPFSQHYVTNFLLGVLFFVFALSLFGMFELVLPSWLVNLTAAKEGRGGVVGTVFMALTFSIISFTCVAPFYGGFIGLMSTSETVAWWSKPEVLVKLCLGALIYSLTFASPFFLLALFPTLLRALPKSGSWMNIVKVVMGFLELAAAIKLFRTAELSLTGKAEYLTFDIALGGYIALALACGVYLLGLFRLPHDDGAPAHLGVARLLVSIAFIGLGLYMVPGLFKDSTGQRQRPSGVAFNWVESFLLPDEHFTRFCDLQQALKAAEDEKKLVFIDFTGLV